MKKAKILIVDTYYPGFLKTLKERSDSYEEALAETLWQSFGTADFYSRNLKAIGWEAVDVIANDADLQQRWAREHMCFEDVLLAQIKFEKPDVVFFQNLSVCELQTLAWLRQHYLLAGQCSCPMPQEDKVRQFHVLFTSFPHYLARFEALGVKAVYNSLCFEPVVLERTTLPPARDIDVSFVGGVGAPSHWKQGMETLELIAKHIPTFKWWGYGADLLPLNCELRAKYQGEAWGLDMYDVLRRSRVVINRHGEVAEDCANNMRLYEATGCGAVLVTEARRNLSELFDADEVVTYETPGEAVLKIQALLQSDRDIAHVSWRGHVRTMRAHSYWQRMLTVSDSLMEMAVA